MRVVKLYYQLKQRAFGGNELSAIYVNQVGISTTVKFLSILISFIYIPIVLGFLDQEKYGIWVTLSTIVNWIRLLDVGMGNGLRNKLAETIVLKQFNQGKILVSTAYGLLGGIFLTALLFFHLINPFLDWQGILNSELISQAELRRITSVAVTFIVVSFILQTVNQVYTAHGNSSAGGVIQLIISSITLLLVWLTTIFSAKGNLILLAWIITGIPVLVYLFVTAFTFIRKYPHLRPSFRSIRVSNSGSLVKLSAQFFIVQITATITFSSIPFIIAQLFGPSEVTVFSIANSIFNIPIMAISLVTAPILPLVTQAYTKGDQDWLRSMLKKMNIVAFVIAIGTILLIIISPIIYRLWVGDKVIIPFILSLTIGVYSIINILTTPFAAFINGLGKIKILVILAPVGIVLFISLSIWISRLTDNVVGVAIALGLANLIGLIVLPAEVRKYIKKK